VVNLASRQKVWADPLRAADDVLHVPVHVSVHLRFEQRASLDGPLPAFQIREVIGDVLSIASGRTMIPSPSHRASKRPMRGT